MFLFTKMPLKWANLNSSFPKVAVITANYPEVYPYSKEAQDSGSILGIPQKQLFLKEMKKKKVLDSVKSIFAFRIPRHLIHEGTCFSIAVPRHRESRVSQTTLGQDKETSTNKTQVCSLKSESSKHKESGSLIEERIYSSNSRVSEKAVR